jgi:hypothetical protein
MNEKKRPALQPSPITDHTCGVDLFPPSYRESLQNSI